MIYLPHKVSQAVGILWRLGLAAALSVPAALYGQSLPTASLLNSLTNGNLPSVATQTLISTFGDPGGPSALNVLALWIGSSPYAPCQMEYLPHNNVFYFFDHGTVASYTLGASGQVNGYHCGLNLANSSVTVNSSNITLSLDLTLQQSAVGPQGVYLQACDNNGCNDSSAPVATWTAFALLTNNPPSAVSPMTPSPTAGSSQTLHYHVADGNGYTYLQSLGGELYTTSGNSPCYFGFQFPNLIYVYQIANGTYTFLGEGYLGGSWTYPSGTNGVIGGSGGLPGPGTCSIDLTQSSVYNAPGGNALVNPNPGPVADLYLDLKTALDGTAQGTLPLSISLSAYDIAGGWTGWTAVGSWPLSAPAPSISPGAISILGGGGIETARVAVASGASWSASSNVSWITFPYGNTGTGNGTLYYQVAQNPSSTTGQQGTITVTSAGGFATLTVNEAAFASGGPTAALSNQLSNGSLGSQTTQTLTLTVGSPNGPGYLNAVQILINDVYGGAYSCQMYYYPSSNAFYFDDPGTSTFTYYTLGTAGQQATGSHCILNVANSSLTLNPSSATASVTLNLALTLQPSAVGTQNVYIFVDDLAYSYNNYWNSLATWTAFNLVTTNPPTASMASAPETGASQVLHYHVNDGNGYTYLSTIYGNLTNGSPSDNGPSPCYFEFQFPNLIYLNQIANGTYTFLGEGYIGGSWSYPSTNGIIGGSGGLAGPGTCSIDLNQSKVYNTVGGPYALQNPNAGSPWQPITDLYLDLWTGLDSTAQGTLPLNVWLAGWDLMSAGSWANVGTWIANPAPSLSSLYPSSLLAGSAGQALQVNGNSFLCPSPSDTAASTVTYNGAAQTISNCAPSQLTISLTSGALSAAGSYPVVVTNPTPGGGSSAATFTVLPAPVITSLNPTWANTGSSFTLYVYGTDFTTASEVFFGGLYVSTTFVSSTELEANIPASDISGPGSYAVIVSQGGVHVNGPLFTAYVAQTITFGSLNNVNYGAAPFAVSATASSGLAVAFSSATTAVCTVSGATVTITATGTCTINANQSGNGTYSAAPQVQQSLTVYPPISVSISASVPMTSGTVSAWASQPVTFTATVSNVINGGSTGVTWSLNPQGQQCGSYTSSSNSFNYTAPAQIPPAGIGVSTCSNQTLTLTATSLANSSEYATAAIALTVGISPAALEENLGPMPFDHYDSSPLSQYNVFPSAVSAGVPGCSIATGTVRGCMQSILANYASQGVTGIRFHFALGGGSWYWDGYTPVPSYSTPFLPTGESQQWAFQGYSQSWLTNLQSFFDDLASAGITNVTPTSVLSGYWSGTQQTFTAPYLSNPGVCPGESVESTQSADNSNPPASKTLVFFPWLPFGLDPTTGPGSLTSGDTGYEPGYFYADGQHGPDGWGGSGWTQGFQNESYNCSPANPIFWGWDPYVNLVHQVAVEAAQANLNIEEFDIDQEINLESFTVFGRLIWDNSTTPGTPVLQNIQGALKWQSADGGNVPHFDFHKAANFSTPASIPTWPGGDCGSVYGDSAYFITYSELLSAVGGWWFGWAQGTSGKLKQYNGALEGSVYALPLSSPLYVNLECNAGSDTTGMVQLPPQYYQDYNDSPPPLTVTDIHSTPCVAWPPDPIHQLTAAEQQIWASSLRPCADGWTLQDQTTTAAQVFSDLWTMLVWRGLTSNLAMVGEALSNDPTPAGPSQGNGGACYDGTVTSSWSSQQMTSAGVNGFLNEPPSPLTNLTLYTLYTQLYSQNPTSVVLRPWAYAMSNQCQTPESVGRPNGPYSP